MKLLDTNVLLYAISEASEDTVKKERSVELLMDPDVCVSAQVLAEFYHNATRKIATTMSEADVLEWLEALALPCVAVDRGVALRGMELAQRYRISYWDAAIIAAAQTLGCDTVYSEDLNAGQQYATVRIVNPYAEAA